jgi:hypothetical protein
MPEVTVGRFVPVLAALALSSCAYPMEHGRDNYAEGMRRLRYDPSTSPDYFSAAEKDFADALAHGDLDLTRSVMAVTMRARCLIELERHTEVPELLATPLPGYDPRASYPGDMVTLSLLKASKLDPEHGYSELLLAEKKAATVKARVHIAWAQVHLLQRIGTAKSRAEGIRICDAYAGKLDFDELKRQLSTP